MRPNAATQDAEDGEQVPQEESAEVPASLDAPEQKAQKVASGLPASMDETDDAADADQGEFLLQHRSQHGKVPPSSKPIPSKK